MKCHVGYMGKVVGPVAQKMQGTLLMALSKAESGPIQQIWLGLPAQGAQITRYSVV